MEIVIINTLSIKLPEGESEKAIFERKLFCDSLEKDKIKKFLDVSQKKTETFIEIYGSK